MTIIHYIAGAGIMVMSSAWIFSTDAKLPELEARQGPVIMACSEVIKSSDTRFVAQPFYVPVPVKPELPKMIAVESKPLKVCRRGERIWYYNKSKKRQMYRIRKDC